MMHELSSHLIIVHVFVLILRAALLWRTTECIRVPADSVSRSRELSPLRTTPSSICAWPFVHSSRRCTLVVSYLSTCVSVISFRCELWYRRSSMYLSDFLFSAHLCLRSPHRTSPPNHLHASTHSSCVVVCVFSASVLCLCVSFALAFWCWF